MTEVILSPVNESRSGSLHAMGAIIIITAIITGPLQPRRGSP